MLQDAYRPAHGLVALRILSCCHRSKGFPKELSFTPSRFIRRNTEADTPSVSFCPHIQMYLITLHAGQSNACPSVRGVAFPTFPREMAPERRKERVFFDETG